MNPIVFSNIVYLHRTMHQGTAAAATREEASKGRSGERAAASIGAIVKWLGDGAGVIRYRYLPLTFLISWRIIFVGVYPIRYITVFKSVYTRNGYLLLNQISDPSDHLLSGYDVTYDTY